MKKNKKNNILIIAAHTDDETLGCAGAIQWHIQRGDKVYAMSFTDGVSSRSEKKSLEAIKTRKQNSKKVEKLLKFKWIKNLSYPDNQLDTIPLLEIIREIEKVTDLIKPTIVYTHSTSDLNIDHRTVGHATLTALRPEPKQYCKEIRMFEIPSSTDFSFGKINTYFTPNIFLEITKFWKKKEIALKSYKKEMKKYPNSRSLKGVLNLAKVRGNQSGVQMAEAFELVRRFI